MKKSIKIDGNFYLVSQEIKEQEETVKVSKPTNHIFVVDVSYSMSYDLPLIKKQLKNKLPNLMREGDTISIIWFSGRDQSGILKEEVEVKSLKTLTDLNDAIDKWLNPVGLTAFLKPLELTTDIINRIKNNRPESLFSLIFLTDGYNNDCPWNEVISTLKSMENDITSSTFVEYGFYADTQKLTQMASLLGGEKVSTSDFDEFEPVFEKKISSGSASTKKIKVSIDDDHEYDFAFSIENGSVLLYHINDGEILVGDNVNQILFFSGNKIGDELKSSEDTDTILYAGIYVLSDKLLNFDAEKLFYALGDVYNYKQLVNAYGKQKLNEFKNSIRVCIKEHSERFLDGRDVIKPVPDDAYCLMNLIDDLTKLDDCNFYPNHESFQYNRIGRKMETKGSNLSEKEQKQLAEAKNVEEANKILEDLRNKNVDLKFINTNPDKGYPIKDLVWNESRANLSVRVKYEGKVELPENKYEISEVETFKYNTYTLIKDGIVNIDILPVSWSQELDDLLMKNDVHFQRSSEYNSEKEGVERYILIDLKSIPVINRGMVKNISAKELAESEWKLKKLQGDAKVYNHFRKDLFPKESKSYIEAVGESAANWLKEIGITDYNGFNPPKIAGETQDTYMAITLETKIKGLSSLPKVDDVIEKIKNDKELKLNEWVLSNAIINYNEQLKSEIFQSLDEEQRNEVLKNYIIKKSEEMTSKKRKVMQEIAQIKFSLILSKNWFKEFKSFDENKLDLNLDGQSLSFTFDMKEKEVKI